MTLESGPEHGLHPEQGSGQGLARSSEVVIASPGASMTVLRETLLGSQGLVLGPDQTQGQGLNEDLKKQEERQEEKREDVDGSVRGRGLRAGPDGRVTKASLPAHQWRSACMMLQLRQRRSSHVWDEGEASVPGEASRVSTS